MSKLDHTVQKRKIAGNALICFLGGGEFQKTIRVTA